MLILLAGLVYLVGCFGANVFYNVPMNGRLFSLEFGGSLCVAAGSTNSGVIRPQALSAPTPIRLTGSADSFPSGAVRITIHFVLPRVPQFRSAAGCRLPAAEES